MENGGDSSRESVNNDTSIAQSYCPTNEYTATTQTTEINGNTSTTTGVFTEMTSTEKVAVAISSTIVETTTTITQSHVVTTTSDIITEPTVTSQYGGQDTYIQHYSNQDVIDIAKVLYHECRGIPSKTEKACVAWTILNRVDYYNSTVYSIVRAPCQFAFYPNAPVWNELYELAQDVLNRWNREKNGETNVGRVLPKEYLYFVGSNGHNYFRDKYSGSYNIWNYSIESPYEN